MTPPMPSVATPNPVTRVAIALIWQGERLLVALRPAHALEGGRWEFPGGKLEQGETAAAALVRECREELGVTVQPLGLAWRTQVARPDRTLELLFFHARLSAAQWPRPLAADTLDWVAVGALMALPFCSADAELLAALADGRVRAP